MVADATAGWPALRVLSGAVVLLAALLWPAASGCGPGPELGGERQGTASAGEHRPEPAPAAVSEPEPEASPESEAADQREPAGEHEGEHDEEGEHGSEGGHGEHGEELGESGTRYGVFETARETRSGIELVLRFDGDAGVFVGTVTNTGAAPVSRVRVEVHLVGGPELGPTPRVTLAPGETSPVRLDAGGGPFETWTAHVEIGEGEHGGDRHRGS